MSEAIEEVKKFEKEEAIAAKLTGHFDFVTASVQRKHRIWAETTREKFLEVLQYLRDELGFDTLGTVTGLDMGENFQLIYHLENADQDGMTISVKEDVPAGDPVCDSALDIYKNAALYEAEVRSLLGVEVKGVPEDIRYPLPDKWPEGQFPLRKSWKGKEKAAETAQVTDNK